MLAQNKKIVSIIVTYNGYKWIENCIKSLLNSLISNFIIVVDNNSQDGTVEFIEKYYNDVIIIKNNTNIGFGSANNLGLKYALKLNAEYVFLLNQDAWIERETLNKLIIGFQNHPEFGIISPLHLSGDEVNLDNNFSQYINGYSCPWLISDAIMQRPFKDIYEVAFVNAAFWLISRNCIETVGGFDPLFFLYGEDDDFTNRAKFHGFKIGICPSAVGYHDRPQIPFNSENWSSERLFASKLIEMKNLNNHLPPLKHFLSRYIRLMLRKFSGSRNLSKQLSVCKLIIKNYDQILHHREACKIPHRTFLDD